MNKYIYQLYVTHIENMQQTGRNTHTMYIVNRETYIKNLLIQYYPNSSYFIAVILVFCLLFSSSDSPDDNLDDVVLSVLGQF